MHVQKMHADAHTHTHIHTQTYTHKHWIHRIIESQRNTHKCTPGHYED